MSIGTPAPPAEPAREEEPTTRPRRWRTWLARSWVRTALGLAVLGAIVGGLIGFDRLGGGGSELGPLDDRSPEVGEAAPDFALRDLDGNVRQLSEFRSQPVWINFWASWCGPCRRELPEIQRLANEFEDEGLVVLAVNQEESAGTAVSFWEELDLDLPILLDSDREVVSQYRLRGLPNNFFIDREGVVQSLHLGFLTEEQMREGLAKVGLE